MIEAIAEIVNVVSLHGINTIIYGSLEGPLSGSCEISLQRRSACVQDTDPISVVRPGLTERFLKVF